MIHKPTAIKFFVPNQYDDYDPTAEPTLEDITGTRYDGSVIADGTRIINAMDSHPHRTFGVNTASDSQDWHVDLAMDREVRTNFWMIDGHNLRDAYAVGLKQTIEIFHDTNSSLASATKITPNKTLSGLIGSIRPYVKLNGNGHNIVVPDTIGINITTNDFALDWHGRPYGLTGQQWLCHRKGLGGEEYGMYFEDNDLYIVIDDGTNDVDELIAQDICSDDDDVYIIVNFDRSGNASAYVALNGGDLELVGTVDISDATDTLNASVDLYIGTNISESSSTAFHGRVYSFRLWTRLATSDERDDAMKGILPSSGVGIELTHDGLDDVGNDWHTNIDNADATVSGVFMNTPTGSDHGFWFAEYDEVDKKYYFSYFNPDTETGRAAYDTVIGQIIQGRIFTFNGMKPAAGFSGDVSYPGIIIDESLNGIVQTEKRYGRKHQFNIGFQVSTRKQFEYLQAMFEILDGSLYPFYICFNYDDPTPVIHRVRVSGGINWNYQFISSQPWTPSIS